MVAAALAVGASGCLNTTGRVPTTQMATDIDPDTALPAYWLHQPAAASAKDADYDRLFAECEHALRMRYFDIDRFDYREGLLTSKPLISQQFWEFWHHDVGSSSQLMDSSLATYRRTVRWEIAPAGGGGFSATPFVVVEHFAVQPGRITAVTGAQSAVISENAQVQVTSPQLRSVSESRWYAVGRDEPLERALVADVTDRLQRK